MDINIFETLASAGLVRRAQKALDKSSPHISGASPIQFIFEGQQGVLDLHNPNNSQCDCAANGICKHIIAASIFAWQQAPISAATIKENEVPQIDTNTLLASAGKVKIRQLYRQVQRRWQADIVQQGAQVCITIKEHTLHFTNVTTINDIICNEDSQAYALLGVYLWLEQQGEMLQWPDWLQLEQEHQKTLLNQTQTQLKQACYAELIMLAGVPLAQLRSESLLTIELLQIPMEKAGFNIAPLKRLCGTLARYLSGEHLRDKRTVLLELAHVLVMLERQEQTQTQDAEHICPPQQLLCLGGYPWRRSSGAHGLTLVLQDEYGRFITLAESRTTTEQTLNYSQIWQATQLLEGAPSGCSWFGQTQRISNAQLNGWQRLRQLKKTYVEPSEQPLKPQAISDITEIDWQSDYICFAPSYVHQHTFDEATQCMLLSYQDTQRNTLFFSLPYTKLTHHAINNMMLFKQQLPQLIVARIERDSTQWYLRPIAVKLDRWINLYFDDLTDNKTTNIFSNWLAKQSPQPQLSSPRRDKVQQFLLKVLDELAQSHIMPQQSLSEMAQKLGLRTLSHFLSNSGPEHRLKAAYCAEQLLQLSSLKPVKLNELQN